MEIVWEIVVDRQQESTNEWHQHRHLIKMDDAGSFDLVEMVRMCCCKDTDDEIYLVSARMLGAISEIQDISWVPVKVGVHD